MLQTQAFTFTSTPSRCHIAKQNRQTDLTFSHNKDRLLSALLTMMSASLSARKAAAALATRNVSSFSASTRRAFSSRHLLNGQLAAKDNDAPATSEAPAAMTSSKSKARMLKGIVLDHSIDLRHLRPGDQLDIPYELTVSETLQDFWFAAFFDQSRIHTSRPFCR
jgi:hypothetical protein